MSIISDALKKAREARGAAQDETRQPIFRRDPSIPASPQTSRAERGPSGRQPARRGSSLGPVLAIALIAVAAALGLFVLGRGGDSSQVASGERRAGNAQFGIEQIPLPGRHAAPAPAVSGFTLSGIAAFQDHFVAVVNGHVVKAGDAVGDAEVVAISEKAVELDVDGERLILEKTF